MVFQSHFRRVIADHGVGVAVKGSGDISMLDGEALPLGTSLTGEVLHPKDRVYSGVFGHGRVTALLKTADGYAFGHRILFDNGVLTELLIVDVAPRH